MRALMLGTAVALALTGASAAKPSLQDVPEIDEGLFVVGLAHEIRKKCPTIKARIFRAFSTLRELEQTARDLGYSTDEITRHLESKAEKKRLRARAATYMADRGFEQNENGYCALGQAEIAQSSQVGALLRATK